MAEPTTNRLDALDQRMARARRNVPPPRRTAAAIAQAAGEVSVTPTGKTGEQAAPAVTGAAAPAGPAATPTARSVPARSEPAPVPTEVADAGGVRADEAQANLMVRVRRSLDRRLDHVIHELRYRTDIRTSKTELVEMLLWELPEQPGPELTERLWRYRQATPRR